MLNIFEIFQDQFAKAIKIVADNNHLSNQITQSSQFSVEPIKESHRGDIACNIAMLNAKKLNMSPTQLANQIIDILKNTPQISENLAKIECVGPGFINIFLKNNILFEALKSINLSTKLQFPDIGKKLKVNLEYASPNPTGPMHVGHTRGAIFGDVLAKLLQKVGFEVLKEYYINDAGAQIDTLLKSAYVRYLQSCGQNVEMSAGLYPGEYLIEIGNKLQQKYGTTLVGVDEVQYMLIIRDLVVNEMLNLIKADLLALGIVHDSYFSEKNNLHNQNKIIEIIDWLKQQDLVYQGKLEAPKTEKGVGASPEEYSEQEQLLFRSTKFGDDQDRVVVKHDGSPTYFGADLAYLKSKYERGAKLFIMPLGFDHAGYVKRLGAATKAITFDQATLKVILCQMVKFVKNGEPLKMSKRASNFITARQVIDEVGADVLRFIMLTRKNDAPFDFDLEKVIEQSKDNPIFYVQYAHTRCCSVIRNLKNENIEFYNKIFDQNNQLKSIDNYEFLNNLGDDSEINLLKKLAYFMRHIEMAVINFEPHRLAFYLQDICGEFHGLWNKGIENPHLKFIIKNDFNTTFARIYLILALKKIIYETLDIFNIKALEQMA